MSTFVAPLVFAAAANAMLAGDIPLATRIKKLSPYFDPPPSPAKATLALDPREIREQGKKSYLKLRGFIRVSPPKGRCFTIWQGDSTDDQEDIVVCKSTNIAFRLEDLDKLGRLKWQVKTGSGDFGTDLVWNTDYRMAVVSSAGKTTEDPPEYRFIQKCEASRTSAGRRIYLHFFGGAVWTIYLPDEDTMMPQPDPLPNLPSVSSGKKRSVEEAAKPKAEGEVKAEGHGEAKPEGQAAEAPVEEPKEKPFDDDADRQVWHLPRRDSYEMSSRGFQPKGSVTPGLKGTCRYRFDGPPEDPNSGRMECHDADGYESVLLPLTCLGELKK